MQEEIVALSSQPVPIPILVHDDKAAGDDIFANVDSGIYGQSPRSWGGSIAGGSPKKDPVAPYQALPVTAQTITEHLTPALPVIDRGNMTDEVNIIIFVFEFSVFVCIWNEKVCVLDEARRAEM